MQLLRRNSDYALRGLVYMAKFTKGKRFTAASLAEKEKVPAVFLRKVFQKLSRARIVASKRGPRGGFYLVKSPSQVTLSQILEAVQGRVALSDCLYHSNSCSHSKACGVKERLSNVQNKLKSLLDKYTLKDFLT